MTNCPQCEQEKKKDVTDQTVLKDVEFLAELMLNSVGVMGIDGVRDACDRLKASLDSVELAYPDKLLELIKFLDEDRVTKDKQAAQLVQDLDDVALSTIGAYKKGFIDEDVMKALAKQLNDEANEHGVIVGDHLNDLKHIAGMPFVVRTKYEDIETEAEKAVKRLMPDFNRELQQSITAPEFLQVQNETLSDGDWYVKAPETCEMEVGEEFMPAWEIPPHIMDQIEDKVGVEHYIKMLEQMFDKRRAERMDKGLYPK